QRFLGDRDALPYGVEEAVLRHQPALFGHQQGERVEVARVELQRRAGAEQAALGGVEFEVVEAETGRGGGDGRHAASLPDRGGHGNAGAAASHPPPERPRWRGAGSRRDSEAQRTWFAAVAAALLLLGPDAEA